MEDNPGEAESRTSNSPSEDSENDRSDHHNENYQEKEDSTGIGRTYECVFCRRGFTTAQALGGHMNIHRKDRAKSTNPSSSSSNLTRSNNNNLQAIQSQYHFSQQYYSMDPHPHQVHHVNYQTYFPSSTRGNLRLPPNYSHHHESYVQNNSHPIRMDRHRSSTDYQLDLQMGPSNTFNHDTIEEKIREDSVDEDGNDDDELDLELRLGHDP